MELLIDWEKVKKGLECCKASTNDDPFQRCSECPYNDISISVQDCRAVLSADTLEPLKEQEPMTPEEFKDGLLKMFSSIWEYEIDYLMFHDTIGELMDGVMQLYKKAVKWHD